MERFKCLIIEDEPLAAEVLQDYIAQIPFLEYADTCRDGLYAMQVLQKEKIDVIFLDIHLPKIKGLDFLRTLKNPPQVIVTTAYREYALDGYDLNVVDYLLKPIHFNRFLTAVNKLRNQSAVVNPAPVAAIPATTEQAHILININKKKIKLYLHDILYIESKKEYISIVTADNSYITKCTLTDMETQLPKEKFLRIHRSFIVNKERISAFTSVSAEINGHSLPIGRSYRELVQQILAGS